jgi:hypothetical protein
VQRQLARAVQTAAKGDNSCKGKSSKRWDSSKAQNCDVGLPKQQQKWDSSNQRVQGCVPKAVQTAAKEGEKTAANDEAVGTQQATRAVG